MNAVNFAKMSLGMSQGWIMGLADDIKDSPLQRPTANGNHPMWCLGHLAYSEGSLINVLCRGESNPVAEWESLFGAGTQPIDDPGAYPSIDEVIARVHEIRASTMAWLETLSDEDLDKASHASDDMKDWFGTVGQCLAAIPTHFGFHGGQIADARRAAGREVLVA